MTVMCKNHRAESDILDHASSIRNMDPLAVSSGQPEMVQPGILLAWFHNQLERLCSVLRLVHKPMMSRIPTRPWEQTGDRKGPLRGAQPVSLDPSAGAQRGYASLGKLIQRQGLLIPSYLEDKDCDYLHVSRLVAALVANAVNPSSGLGSFATISVSA
jgi:hypothetical protein